MAAGKKVVQGVEERGKLHAALLDVKLKLKLMENWKKRVTDSNEKAAPSLPEVAELNGELEKAVEKRNAFVGRLREVEVESGRQMIRLNTLLLKYTPMDMYYLDLLSSPLVFLVV